MNQAINFSSLGIKTTPARLMVLELLIQKGIPADVETILSYLHKKDLHVNPVTIYRILDLFVEKGIAHRFEFNEGKFRYEIAKKDHHHLVCQECGAIEDISDCGVEDLEKKIARKKQFIVKRHALEFFGLCQNCQE